MKQFIYKYKVYILAFLTISSIVLVLFAKKSPPTPKITSTTPIDQSQNIDLTMIPAYFFDIPISISDITITSNPVFNFQLVQQNTNTLIATHTLNFQPATTYVITIDWQNNNIFTHSFTTVKSQVDSLLIQNMKDELARDYPLGQLTPYTTSSYRVVYSAPMTLEITLKNKDVSPEKAIADIKSWVSNNGGDVSAHQYTIATPSN